MRARIIDLYHRAHNNVENDKRISDFVLRTQIRVKPSVLFFSSIFSIGFSKRVADAI